MQYPGFTEDGIPAIKYSNWAETTGIAYTLYIGPLLFNLSNPNLRGTGFSGAVGQKTASLIEHETEVAYEGKLQITSTKLQINLKSQYPITETHLHFPGRKGNFDLGSMMK